MVTDADDVAATPSARASEGDACACVAGGGSGAEPRARDARTATMASRAVMEVVGAADVGAADDARAHTPRAASTATATDDVSDASPRATPTTRALDATLDALDAECELTEEAFSRPAFDAATTTSATATDRESEFDGERDGHASLYERDTDLEVAEDVDPRVGDALNELNDSMTECNALENALHVAKRARDEVRVTARERLDRVSAAMSTSVKTALPVFHKRALARLYQARSIEALRAYEDAHDAHELAKQRNDELEQDLLASSGRVDIELMEACADAMRDVAETAAVKARAVATHELNTRRAVQATTDAAGLEKSRRGAVAKAQPYFAAKTAGEIECAAADADVARRKLAVRQAKARYDAALRALNEISEEVHARRAAAKLARDVDGVVDALDGTSVS